MIRFLLALLFLIPGSLFAQDQVIEVREAQTPFHRSVMKAAFQARQAGTISVMDVARIRIAMITPAGRQKIEDLAVYQMGFSGSENTPIGADGKVDRASIDWEKLLAFLEKLMPFILQLIDAFGSVDRPVAWGVA